MRDHGQRAAGRAIPLGIRRAHRGARGERHASILGTVEGAERGMAYSPDLLVERVGVLPDLVRWRVTHGAASRDRRGVVGGVEKDEWTGEICISLANVRSASTGRVIAVTLPAASRYVRSCSTAFSAWGVGVGKNEMLLRSRYGVAPHEASIHSHQTRPSGSGAF